VGRQQFGKGERLDQVVIRAALQPKDAVLNRIAGGQQEHRRFGAAGAQGFEDLNAIPSRLSASEMGPAITLPIADLRTWVDLNPAFPKISKACLGSRGKQDWHRAAEDHLTFSK
jgi:hypothetical protein